jgi:lipoyl(octanoyl) transferase
MRTCEFRDLGRMAYGPAFALQQKLASERKQGLIPDQFLIVEHPHVITMGRNANRENVLASPEVLERAGVEIAPTDRGGDVTYHGPGQIVGYPIFDLREWKRDVVAYVRAVEEAIIGALADFGIACGRLEGATGVWTAPRVSHANQAEQAKIAAIGVHLSRWVTSHGFALNHETDLSYFRYIVPCGLTKPVTSMRAEGITVPRGRVIEALVHHAGRVFDLQMAEAATATERA